MKHNVIFPILRGGLGNLLFQLAATHNEAKRSGKTFICSNQHIIQSHHTLIEVYKQTIFKHIRFVKKVGKYHVYKQSGYSCWNYTGIPQIAGNVMLDGYFINKDYFEETSKEFVDLLCFDGIKEKYSNVLTSNMCSLHVRRGDYLTCPLHVVQSIDYYKSAVDIIGKDKMFLIFSDDIAWCKQNFSFIKNKIFMEGNADYEDLYLMSQCDHNINANSTFSWWGAWLNTNEDKIVIAPKNYFSDQTTNNTAVSYIYPKNWIQL
jgi:hypothetical protein